VVFQRMVIRSRIGQLKQTSLQALSCECGLMAACECVSICVGGDLYAL
jgi:hypothetical protein